MNSPDIRTARAQRIKALGYDFAGQPKERRLACNLCGETVLVTINHTDRYGYPATADACSRCGLTFLNPVMNSAAYTQFYIDVYRPLVSAYHGRLIDAQTIQAEQRDYAADLVRFLEPDLRGGKAKTMLDIGGSTGVVAHALVEAFGLSGTLIDPAPMEVEVARKLGLETVTGFVEDHEFGSRRFDVVIICQTVDHLLNIAGTLNKVRQVIADDGWFFVDIVDFRAAYLRNHATEGAIKIDHPYYLTEPTMLAYLRRAGFAVTKVNYAGDHLHVGFLCRPAAPEPDYLPSESTTEWFFREVRWVHNSVAGRP